ncbi:hypothetical protein, partial [Geobacillus thermoleovorans]|uniref:hypothetical protein n=1 Tax=Geobacillus thermoleovorans TaxID=33941 RepID=UPI00272E5C6C
NFFSEAERKNFSCSTCGSEGMCTTTGGNTFFRGQSCCSLRDTTTTVSRLPSGERQGGAGVSPASFPLLDNIETTLGG